jgi:hypothetical protein
MKKPYWYLITFTECPVCGKVKRRQERQYGKRPKHQDERHILEVAYDYCDGY